MTLKHAKGFTLIEVLIAIAILATGLVLVVEAMGRTQHALRVSENLVAASGIAENQIGVSELEVRQWHKLRTGTDHGEIRSPGRKFKWEKITGPYQHPTIQDETKLSVVQVKVTWPQAGRENDLSLGSLFLNREKKQ